MFISCKDDNNLREITDDEKIFEYIGLKDKANVIEAQEKVWNTYGRPYRPSVQVVDGYIYIATWSGIYRKPAKSLNNMDWEKFAFSGLPVIQFVMKGDSIIAITACTDEKAFVLSTDGGKTWKYISMSGYRWGGFCYGGYAVDENTYFVGVSDAWHNPRKLKITFDGGKTIVDTGMYFTKENINAGIESSYQSPTNPKVLFACDLRSEDGGHTWAKMNGCINVYTHNPKGQKELYGMDETGKYVVTSYDDGKTWEKVNKTEFIPNPKYESAHILDVAYDWKNEVAYAACEGGYLYKTSTKDGCVLNRYVDEYKRAPVNLKGGYSISKVAVDPIDPNIIYCGGAGNTFLNDCALYRSVDGGKSFQVITSNKTNSIVKQGRQGGFETNSLEVNPKTGELLFAGGCFGISKLSPPYKLNNK